MVREQILYTPPQIVLKQLNKLMPEELPTKSVISGAWQEKLQDMLQKYRADPRGIRNEPHMAAICLKCGSDNVGIRSVEEPYFIRCLNCGNEWYSNNCWNCDDGLVDSRDPETLQCSICGWYRCKKCGACSWHGCSTNPYHKGNRLRDRKQEH
jgi:hypothetical protein